MSTIVWGWIYFEIKISNARNVLKIKFYVNSNAKHLSLIYFKFDFKQPFFMLKKKIQVHSKSKKSKLNLSLIYSILKKFFFNKATFSII